MFHPPSAALLAGKGQGRGAAASQGGPADVAAVTDRNKRQCRMQQHTDAAEEEYEQPAAASGGQSAGNKRRRGGQAQEEAPPSAPVTASQRKQPRKSAAQQQQQQPRGRAAAAGGAAPDSAGVEQEEDVFHDAEEEQADGSDDYAPEQQRKQQQQRSNKKARNSGQQQPKRRRQAAESDVDEPDEDMQDADGGAADEEDAELDEVSRQQTCTNVVTLQSSKQMPLAQHMELGSQAWVACRGNSVCWCCDGVGACRCSTGRQGLNWNYSTCSSYKAAVSTSKWPHTVCHRPRHNKTWQPHVCMHLCYCVYRRRCVRLSGSRQPGRLSRRVSPVTWWCGARVLRGT